ncbi:MAG: lysophospholipase [Bacteroidales bacterium]|jgi:alpha-beta hydrolase superfamily lysophospholipase|nr:lysophospholipase [Bacteroidales bacterium]
MRVKEYYLNSKKIRLYVKQWLPDHDTDLVVIMVHGIGEYSGCYEHWAERFVAQSIGFVGFDLRGHGRSSGKRGHASLHQLMTDTRIVVKKINKACPHAVIILYGHSMGAHIALNYALTQGVKVQGIIASSPWLKLVRPPSPMLVNLARAGSSIFPSLTVKTGIKRDQLSSSEVQKSTKTDPLLHKKISIKLFTDLWKNGEIILKLKHRLNIPLLLMHGEDDPLVSCQASQAFANNAGAYTSFKLWKGMKHELLSDAENEAVFQHIIQWIMNVYKNGNIQNNYKKAVIA